MPQCVPKLGPAPALSRTSRASGKSGSAPRCPPPLSIRATRRRPADTCGPCPDCLEPIMICPTLVSPKPTKSGYGAQGQDGRPKRPKRNFRPPLKKKPRIDTRIYRNGEYLCLSFAGHIPGEQYIHSRNLPTATTFAKRRLKTYTPYEYVEY